MSLVSMCNAALIKVGGDQIISLTTDSKSARLCKSRWRSVMDAALQAHKWNFAIERATLTPSATDPNHEWDYKFLMPTNPYCLRVLEVYEDFDFEVEGRYIMCDESSIKIKYIKRVTDYNIMPPLFVELFALYLAVELAFPIAGDKQLKQLLVAEAGQVLREARLMDAQEGTPKNLKTGTWYNNRRRSSSKYVVARQ